MLPWTVGNTLSGCLHGQTGVGCAPNKPPLPPWLHTSHDRVWLIIIIIIVIIMETYNAWYRDGAGNTVEENSSVFSVIRMR